MYIYFLRLFQLFLESYLLFYRQNSMAFYFCLMSCFPFNVLLFLSHGFVIVSLTVLNINNSSCLEQYRYDPTQILTQTYSQNPEIFVSQRRKSGGFCLLIEPSRQLYKQVNTLCTHSKFDLLPSTVCHRELPGPGGIPLSVLGSF